MSGYIGSVARMKLNMSMEMKDATCLQMFRKVGILLVTVARSLEYVVIVNHGSARTFRVTHIRSVWYI